MFPYLAPDYDFQGYVYAKESGSWKPKSMETAFEESEVSNIWDGYVRHYHVCHYHVL